MSLDCQVLSGALTWFRSEDLNKYVIVEQYRPHLDLLLRSLGEFMQRSLAWATEAMDMKPQIVADAKNDPISKLLASGFKLANDLFRLKTSTEDRTTIAEHRKEITKAHRRMKRLHSTHAQELSQEQ